MKEFASVKIVRSGRVENASHLESLIAKIRQENLPTAEAKHRIAEAKLNFGKTEPRPLEIRVIFNREKRNYAFGCDTKLTEDEFKNGRTNKAKLAIEKADAAAVKAKSIASNLGKDFTFSKFKTKFHKELYGKKDDKSLFRSAGEEYINGLHEESRPHYRTAMNALLLYSPKLRLQDIDKQLILSFQQWAQETRSDNTIRMYLREIKAIYNRAVVDGMVEDSKPFDGITLASIRRTKRALSESEFQSFVSATPETTAERFGYDMFRLIFLLDAPNFIDIITLKNSDVNNQNNTVAYNRHKTQHRDASTTYIKLSPEAILLLNQYGHLNPNAPEDYILKFLRRNASAKTIKETNRRVLKKINKGISDICDRIGIQPFKTYNIRHTVASRLRDAHMTVEEISKLMGHSSPTTTNAYLDSLGESVTEKAASVLTSLLDQSK